MRVVIVGLGATGRSIAHSLLRRCDVQVVGASDKDPRHVGEDLGSLLGNATANVTVVEHLESLPPADLAVVATTSDLNQVAKILVPLLERSYNVLSICEELAYPWESHPELAAQLDRVARAQGVTLLGSGANPGMLMDTLPLLLTALTQKVERVVIRRRTNMSRYGAILSKFGLGLTPTQFTDAQVAGDIIGHHGFEQTIGAVAAGLKWKIDQIEVDPVVPSIVSKSIRIGDYVTIESGQISAVTHAARGVLAGDVVVDLEILFGFFDKDDEVTEGDDYRIVGVDQVIVLSSDIGFESFLSTIAVAVNASAAVVSARPGLLSMGDIPPLALASKGAMLSVEQRA